MHEVSVQRGVHPTLRLSYPVLDYLRTISFLAAVKLPAVIL
jgi:hypothetical protein